MLYVGKAKDLKVRVSSYFVNDSLLGEKTRLLVSQIKKIKITVVESELESLLLEAYYIKKYAPKYNVRMTDDKSYPLIKITMSDRYPKVLFARRADDPRSLYFGPYPNSGAVKTVLKIVRRVFPFQSVQNHPNRICLYNHLGLCPCPIVNNSRKLKKEYRRNIKNIIRILEGKSQKIMQELEREREKASKAERFEAAQKLQRKIQALSIITQPYHRPFEYDVNPNLRDDIRQQELKDLQDVLKQNGLDIDYPVRIECYDISNIQGTNATGSLVVLTHGEIDKSQYRKFKIRRDWEKQGKNVISTSETRRDPKGISPLRQAQGRNDKGGKPNDFAMMEEVLQRRIKHKEWAFPDLIIVDGGKGQVSSALKVLESHQVEIPLIGLAKREETIIVPVGIHPRHSGKSQRSGDASRISQDDRDPGQARMTKGDSIASLRSLQNDKVENFREISLSKDSPALHLIQRIRDEAHRFAIAYHRKLRSKTQFS